MEHETLGGRIKARRRGLDLSQSELGGLIGGMSQAWVSRVETDRLTPDSSQLEALESALGPLSHDSHDSHASVAGSVGQIRGPAVYKAARLANENAKRRAELALRMESLQKKEDASNETLSAARKLAVDFIQDFVEQAVELPADVLEDLQPLGINAFEAVDDDTHDLIAVRNKVVQQLGIQIKAAAPTSATADAMIDSALALAAVTAVEAFATSATDVAIRSIGRSALSTATGLRGSPFASGGLGAALGLRSALPIGATAAPFLIAAGVVVTVAGRRHLKRAQDERSQLLEAGIELDRLQVAIDEYYTQAETAASLLEHAREHGTSDLKRLQDDVAADADVNLETLIKVVALILTLLPLPVPDGPSELAPLGATHRANELALETAEAWLAEAGALN